MVELERMIYWVRKEITGTASQEINDEDVVDLLNFSLWNIEAEFDFKTREQLRYTTLVEGQSQYDISGIERFDAITSLAVIAQQGARHKLSRTTRDWLDSNANFERDRGFPTRYIREADTLTLHPVPSQELELELHFRQGVESLTKSSVTVTGLPRNWDEIVIAGAVWRGLKAHGAPLERIQTAVQTTSILIRSAKSVEEKETKDARWARLNVIWDHPEDHLQGHEGG